MGPAAQESGKIYSCWTHKNGLKIHPLKDHFSRSPKSYGRATHSHGSKLLSPNFEKQSNEPSEPRSIYIDTYSYTYLLAIGPPSF